MASVYKRPRSPFWQARVIVNGQLRRVSTSSTDHREAQKAADEIEAELNRLVISENELRLSTASERFFRQKTELKPKTVINYKSSQRSIQAKLGDFPLSLLDRAKIKVYIETRLMETGSVAIKRDLAFLSSVYKTAQNWSDGPDSNPVKDFDKSALRDAQQKSRWLTELEFNRLVAACNQPIHRHILICLVETGLRISELLGLQWSDVDFTNNQLIIFGDRTKNSDYRIVPLTARASDTLSEMYKVKQGEVVFMNLRTKEAYTTFQKTWVQICKRAKVPNCTIHTLRHTFASWGLQRGIGEISLQHWMGHKTRSMTKRYAKSSYESLQQAADVFSKSTLYSTQRYNQTKESK